MFELIIYGLILAAVIWLIVKVVIPILGFLSVLALGIGTVIAVVMALICYIRAMIRYRHPYNYYVDKAKKRQPAKRSYFFGPGFLQLGKTIGNAWSGMANWLGVVNGVAGSIMDFFESGLMKIAMFFPTAAFVVASYATLGLLGSIVTVAFCIIHSTIVLSIMCVIYVLFAITWLVDRLYLWRHSIKTSCPYCQHRYTIPLFECPECNEIHTKLVPGPYGIWRRKCNCGEVLPSTFFNGRSKLVSYCPNPDCGSRLAASDAQQIAISVVGGSSSGKTVLLSAFYHSLFEIIKASGSDISVEIPEIHQDIFEDMERWYQGAVCDPTAVADTATMYSVLLDSDKFDARKQFSIYDIAGEAFRDPAISAMLPQQQFKHADGIVIVIDPLTSNLMRQEADDSGDDTTNYSEAEASMIITNFVTYLKTTLTSMGITKAIEKPVSVVITKADLSAVKRRISYTHIRSEVKQGLFEDFDTARDELCKQFLSDIGMHSVVQAVTASFRNVHYYPVSAIGHEPDGEVYEPEHIMEPFTNIIASADASLSGMLKLAEYV